MKHFNRVKKYGARVAAGACGLLLSALAAASPPATAYDTIVAAVDWGDVVTGVTAIAALLAAVFVVKRGVKMLLGIIGR